MTSSPIPADRSQYLLDLLAQVPDPRKRRGRRHPLAGLLAVGVAAVIAGSRSFPTWLTIMDFRPAYYADLLIYFSS